MRNWTKRYIHATKFVSKRSDTEYVYETEFSIPSNVQPVPEAAVKIHSTITFTDAEISDFWYTFENETLRHRENRSIRIAQMETWIDRMYKDKMSVRGMVNMLTKFESTRIIHEEIEDDERFYAACDLLESQMDEQDPDEEIDLETKSLFEEMGKLSAETNISKGASKPKHPVEQIDTFAAIAGVLGKVEESTGK